MDTAQLSGAAETDPNVAIANAADAFKAFTADLPIQPRDEQGRFASAEEPEAVAEDEIDGDEPEVAEEAEEDEQEAAEEAQPMPPSWPADKAEIWEALPAEARSFVAERDAEQLRAVNAKFQDAANVRKAAEALQAEAQTNRTQYAEALETLMAAIQPVKPDPRAFGAGTGQYNSEAYAIALAEYDTAQNTFAQLQQQRNAIKAEAAKQDNVQFEAWKQELEAQFAPKFMADVPDLTDAAKAEPLMRELVTYAIANGIPESTFAPDEQKFITSAQLHILWKAQQFDKLRTSPPAAKPKPAGPVVKPGVSSPRSAQKAAQRQIAHDRLAREGSIEAGAAVFKQLFK